tara:strand:+ start:165 stop:482 length:318 start_codon:yes stop_codon:yes gene_type:complete
MTDGDLSGNLTTAEVSVRYLDNVAIQAVWVDGGSLSGEFKIDGSVDGTNFEELDLSTTTAGVATVTGSDQHLIELINVSYDRIRVRFVFSAGAGTGQVHVMAKSN